MHEQDKPIRHNNELVIHYSGRACAHGKSKSCLFGGIGVASLRVDGFCSLQAKEREGFILTQTMRWPKAELYLNVDPRHDITTHPHYGGGEVKVEARNSQGIPINGFRFDDCVPVVKNTSRSSFGDATCQVEWKQNKRMESLARRQIRLAFKMRDAHLYSFKTRRPENK